MKFFGWVLTLALVWPFTVFAQSADERTMAANLVRCLRDAAAAGAEKYDSAAGACEDQIPSGNDSETNDFARSFRIWDFALNAIYKQALLDAELSDPPATQKVSLSQSLRAAQRSWLVYRDTECKFITSQFMGGSAASLAASSCMSELSRERALRLNALSVEGLVF